MSDVDCLIAGYVIVTNDGWQVPTLYSSVGSAKGARTAMYAEKGFKTMEERSAFRRIFPLSERRKAHQARAAEFASIYPVYRGTKPVG